MSLFCKSKLRKILKPIEYYSAEFSNGLYQNSKVSLDEVEKYLKPYLAKILLYYNIPFELDFAQTPGIITSLLEKTDSKSSHILRSDIEYKKSMMYYCGTITQCSEKANRLYKSCKFQKSEDYAFLVNCLVKLYSELICPNTDTPFEDFPEHIIATYNVLCYYYLNNGNDRNIAEICRVLYSFSDYYITNEEILWNSSKIKNPITNKD